MRNRQLVLLGLLPLVIIPPLQMGINWPYVVSTATWVASNPLASIDVVWDAWGGAIVTVVTFVIENIGWILAGITLLLVSVCRALMEYPQLFQQEQQPYGSLPVNNAFLALGDMRSPPNG